MMAFAERFKQLRNEKGISQRELAKLLSFGASTVAMYETGQRQPDGETLVKIADYFDVSADYLLGRTDIKNPEAKTIYTGKEIFDKVPEEYKDLVTNESMIKFFDKMKQEDITPELMTELFESIIKIRKSMKTND